MAAATLARDANKCNCSGEANKKTGNMMCYQFSDSVITEAMKMAAANVTSGFCFCDPRLLPPSSPT